MKISDIGIKLIEFFEGYRKTPYLCPANYVTVGIGHVIIDPKTKKPLKGVKGLAKVIADYPNGVDAAQIYKWLNEDLVTFEKFVNTRIKIKLTQSQFDALVSHTYNTGGSDTLFNLINTMPLESESIKIWWKTRYITGGGKPLNGLVARRKTEYELFNTGELKI